MTHQDIEILLNFTLRTEMYAQKDKAGYIIAFIHGYETGRNGDCDFLNQLDQILENQFHFKSRAMGWNGQLIQFSDKYNLTWETSFKKISLKVLSKHFKGEFKNKYEKILKFAIRSNINNIESGHWFGKRWINKWFGLVDLEEKWFRDIWTKEELKIIAAINHQINQIQDKEQANISASKELIELSSKF